MILGPVDLVDSTGLRGPITLRIADGMIVEIKDADPGAAPRPILCPPLVDLQVNGGGGRILNDAQSTADIDHISAAHRQLGTGRILPTLISDTPETTARILEIAARHGDLLGLHLEGPHLAVAGAHDPALLRPMTEADLAIYANAAQNLPLLMITLAPEQVTPDQIARLRSAGIIVALGHSNCSYDTANSAIASGASMVTHLFNAMSGLHHRNPGLVGATLDSDITFGIIADGHHVHDAALRLAHRMGADRMIPVSDAMALTGSDAAQFRFQGREIRAEATRLTLPDGTLAGARASLLDGLRHLAAITGVPLTNLLPLGFQRPLELLGQPAPVVEAGAAADMLVIHPDGRMDMLTPA